MDDREQAGVVFPAGPDGRRGTTALGKAVVAAALRPVDPAGAAAAERATAWRKDYVVHFRRLVEAGLDSPEAWLTVARSGLAAVHERMRFARPDGIEVPLAAALTEPAGHQLGTTQVCGDGEPGEFVLPYGGEQLRGDAIRRCVDGWIGAGVAEPSLAAVVDAVLAHPDWLRLDGMTVTALGAGAEMGPLPTLLRWGATVAAVDLPRPAIWDRLRRAARRGAGRLLLPEAAGTPGVDLLAAVPAVADWLAGLPGRPVLGNYAYADGGRHVRLTAAADLVALRLRQQRPELALAFLATPTDVFAVPREAVAQSAGAYRRRPPGRKLLGAATGGRLLRPAYPPDADPGISDSLVPTQGPNYALAKRVQRWRAAVARAEGGTVSLHVAPSTRTRSVLSRRALAAAFAGAHHFGVEVFGPPTANTLMAALLVHDLNAEPVRHEHPWQDEAYAAVHGGLWRTAYAPRSALGLAAVLGFPTRSGRARV